MDADNDFVIPAKAGIQVLSNRRGRSERRGNSQLSMEPRMNADGR